MYKNFWPKRILVYLIISRELHNIHYTSAAYLSETGHASGLFSQFLRLQIQLMKLFVTLVLQIVKLVPERWILYDSCSLFGQNDW